jgi:chaperone modulatory protein CbpM
MSQIEKKAFALVEVIEITGVDHQTLFTFVEREWISPEQPDQFDQEDLARIRLIQEFRHQFGANDEAISLILHLMDQMYYLRSQIRKLGDSKS